jgi:hypothetical protein
MRTQIVQSAVVSGSRSAIGLPIISAGRRAVIKTSVSSLGRTALATMPEGESAGLHVYTSSRMGRMSASAACPELAQIGAQG